ncbi:MAG: hypothetical protein AAF481_02125 [Acidobacteriota bacterium]
MNDSPLRFGPIFALVISVAVSLWLLIAQLPGRSLLRAFPAEIGQAEWIWTEGPRDRRSPVAFYALRDFHLAELGRDPAESPAPAVVYLEITADEEYDAFLNGVRLGSGRLAASGLPSLDRWPAAHALRPGTNRLAVEVRSARGAGGLLARLVDGAGRSRVATDDRWQISRRALRGLVTGWQPLDRAEPAFSWGRPPAGRWGSLQSVLPRTPPALGAATFEPRRGRILGPGQAWYDMESGPPVQEVRRAIPGAVFDFGEEITGHLHLGFGGNDLRCALAFVGPRPAGPFAAVEAAHGEIREGELPDGEVRPTESVSIVLVSGARHWRDTVARQFRYVTVLGAVGGVVAWVEQAPPLAAAEKSGPRRGVEALGIRPPRLRTPIEDEVGRELQRFPALAGGKDL